MEIGNILPMIYFRQTDEPRVGKGIFWHVEYYAEEGSVFPVGTAYVEALPQGYATLVFILVADQWRSRGVANALVAACSEKWPGLRFSQPISKEGKRTVRRAMQNREWGEKTSGRVAGMDPTGRG